jgi:predicted NBD/HSP70 family sugar kinase
MIEVPVSTPVVIRDRATEMLHLGLAAGLGAALAAGATAARQRRRPSPPTDHPNGLLADNLIDITDIVQSRAVSGVTAVGVPGPGRARRVW